MLKYIPPILAIATDKCADDELAKRENMMRNLVFGLLFVKRDVNRRLCQCKVEIINLNQTNICCGNSG